MGAWNLGFDLTHLLINHLYNNFKFSKHFTYISLLSLEQPCTVGQNYYPHTGDGGGRAERQGRGAYLRAPSEHQTRNFLIL